MGTRHIFLMLLSAALFAAGCQTQPKTTHGLANESDIRLKIVGTWSAETFEGTGKLTLTFGADGSIQAQRPGSQATHAAWRSDGSWLLVTSKKDELVSTSLDYWSVWHIDDHELVFRRGFSTAGPPERFTR